MELNKWLEDDYYTLLGINQNAKNEDINKGYRLRAKSIHPDAFPLDSIERDLADKKFKKLTEIRDILLDSEKRMEYDNQRLTAQQLYFSYVATNYYPPPPVVTEKEVKPKVTFKDKLKEQMEKVNSENSDYIYSDEDKAYVPESQYSEEPNKEELSRKYKKEGAKKFYKMALQYLMYKNYDKAMTYFKSAQYLDPTLRIPRQHFPD